MRVRVITLSMFVLAACSSELPHEAAFDPLAPLEKQAKGQLTGTLTLEGESDHSQVTVQLQNDSRTYSVDTDAKGTVRLTGVVPGVYALSIRTRYFEPISDTIEISLGETHELGAKALKLKTSAVVGSALLEQTVNGAPVQNGGVIVSLAKKSSIRSDAAAGAPAWRAAAGVTTPTFSTVSTANGQFQLSGVPAGVYAVAALAGNGLERNAGEVRVTGEGVAVVDDIVLKKLSGALEIEGTLADGTTKSNRYTNSPAVVLRLDQTNAEQVKLAISTDGTVAGCALGSVAAEPIVATKTITLSGEGEKLVCARFIDAAGEESEVASAAIVFDQTAPNPVNVQAITSGGYVNVNNVLLNLSAADGVSGVRSLAWSLSPAAVTAAVPQPFVQTISIPLAAQGAATIFVQIIDATGNRTAPIGVPVIYDAGPPVFSAVLRTFGGALLSDGATVKDLQVVLEPTVSDSFSPVEMQVSSSLSFLGVPWEAVSPQRFVTLNPPQTASGELRTISVRARDAAGNMNLTTATWSINVDTVAPVFSALNGPATSNVTGVTLTLVASGADQMRLSENADFSGANWAPFAASPAFALSNADGSHTVYVELRDNAGNESVSRSTLIALDSAPPATPVVSILGGAYTKTAAISVQTIADGASEILMSQQADMLDATWAPFAQVKSFALTGAEGAKTLYVRVRDAAGNVSGQASASITYDQTPPVVTMWAVDGQGNLLTQTNQTRYYLRLSVTDATPVLAQFNSSNSFTGIASEVTQTARAWDVVATPVATGTNYNTYVRVADAAGNATTVGPVTVLVDTMGPTAPNIALSPGLTSDATVTVTLAASNADYVELSENISFIAPAVITYTTSTSHTFTPGEGPKTLYARFADQLGNYSPIVAAATVLDSTPPENTSFSIAQPDPTNDDTLDLTLSASGAAQMAVGEGAVCSDAWEPYAQSKVLTLATVASMDTTKTIRVRFKDAAGNVSACLQQARRFDNSAPQLGAQAININYGAASTSNGSVTLAFNVTGADEVQVSEDNGFADAAWLPYSATRTFLLSAGNGTKTIHARFRDRAGNMTGGVSDSVILDTTPISVPFITIQADVTSSTTVQVNFSASNVDEMWYSENSDFSTGAWEPYTGMKSVTFGGGDGPKTLYAKFKKSSGAESTVVFDSYILDTAGPILPSVRVNTGATVVAGEIVTLNLSAVDQASGVAVYRINTSSSFSGVSDKAYQPNDLFTLQAGDGLKTLYVIYGDHARNYSVAATVAVILDTSAPVVSSAALETLGGTAINQNDTVRDGRIVLRSSVADLTPLEMQVTTNGSLTGSGWEPYAASKVIDLTAASSTVSARVRDAAGHVVELLTAVDVDLDNQAPVATFARTSASPSNTLDVGFTVSSTEPGQMQVSADAGFAGAAWDAIGAGTLTLTAGDGVRTLYARVRDAAGNLSDVKTIATIIDQTPPQNTAFSIDGGPYTKSRAVGLTFSGVEITQVRVAENTCAGGYVPHTGTDTFNIGSAGDGLKTIAVQFRDAVGNQSACLLKTVTLDETAPQFGFFRINADAPSATSRSVTLGVSVTGATEIQVSETSNFAGAAWQPVTDTVTFTLSAGEGTKTVFARFRDQAQNLAGPVQDSVWLDTVAPSFYAVNGPAASSVTGITLSVSGSGADLMRLSENADFSGAVWTPFNAVAPFAVTNVQGQHTIYLQLADNAGNVSAIRAHTVSVDSQAPGTPLVSIVGGAYTKVAGITVQTVADGAAEMKIGQLPDLSDGVWAPFAQLKAFSLAGGQGSHTVYVMVRDGALNESGIASATITFDSTPPQVYMTAVDGQSNVISQTNSTRYYMFVAVTDATETQAQFSGSGSFSGVALEPVTVLRPWDVIAPTAGNGASFDTHIKVTDAAGNSTTLGPITVLVDTVGPAAATLSFAAATVSNVTTTANFSAANADFVELSEDISFLVPTVLTYRTSQPWTWSNTADGTKTLYARFSDNLGNYSPIVEATTVLDTAAPRVLGVSVNEGSATNLLDVHLTFAVVDATQMQIREGSCGGAWTGFSETYNHAFTSSTDGLKTIAVRFRDSVGNASACVTRSLTLDRTAPTLTAAKGVVINTDAPYATSNLVSLAFNVAGAAQMQLSNTASFGGAQYLPVTTAIQWSLEPGDGSRSVYVRFLDSTGNVLDGGSDTVVVDSTAPSNTSLTINAGAAFSATTSVTLTLAATDAQSVAVQLSNDGVFDTEAIVAFAASQPWSLSPGDGNKVVYARFIDAAGNTSATVSASIVVDSIAPAVSSVTINGGAASLIDPVGNVTLSLIAFDPGGIASMKVANLTAGTCATALSAVTSEPFQSAKAWVLDAVGSNQDGLRWVCAAFRDGAGSWSAPVSDSIGYDTMSPTGLIIVANPVTNDTFVPIDLIFSSDVAAIKLSQDDSCTGGSWVTPVAQTFTQLPSIEGPHDVSVVYRDDAGNTSACYPATVILDTTGPVPTAFTVAGNVGAAAGYTKTDQLTLTASTGAADCLMAEVAEDVGFINITDTFGSCSLVSEPYTLLSTTQGTHDLYMRYSDNLGNRGALIHASIVFDTSVPTVPPTGAFTIAEGNYVNSANLTLLMNASGADSMAVSQGATCTGSWMAYASSSGFALSGLDGPKTVAVEFKDASDNLSGCYTRQVTLDTTIGSTWTVTVTGTEGRSDLTADPTVMVTIAGTDADIVEAKVSNIATFSDANWVTFVSPFIWVLPGGEGAKTVYVMLRDRAGNETQKSVSITVDTVPPNPPALQMIDITGDGVALTATAVEMSWTLPADTVSYELQKIVLGVNADFATVLTPPAATTEYAAPVTQPGYRHQYRIRAVDSIGNASAWSLALEARPFEALSEVLWIRDISNFRYELLPPVGTFSIETQYSSRNITGATFTEQLTDNITTWMRSQPSGYPINEQLRIRTANQDNSLLHEATYDLPFAYTTSPEDACTSEGQYTALESFGNALYMTGRRDCGLVVWKWEDGVWTTWNAGTGGGFYGVDLAIGSNGTMHIAKNVNNATVDELVYHTGSGSSWTEEVVLTSTAHEWGRYPSIAVDTKNVPHIISYRKNTTTLTYELIWSRRTGGTWTSTAIDSFASATDIYGTLTADNLGRLHVVYFDPDTIDFVYRKYENGAWGAAVVLRDTSLGSPARGDVKVDGAGIVHIVADFGLGNFYYHDTNSPGTFVEEQIHNENGTTGQNYLSLDAQGNPSMTFDHNTLNEVWVSTRSAGTWKSARVAIADMERPAIVIHDGYPVVAYYDNVLSSVRLHIDKDPAWRPWTEKSLGTLSIYSSDLEFDADGYAHVAYSQTTCRSARVATDRPNKLSDDFESGSILSHRWPTSTGTPSVLTPGIALPSGTQALNLDGGTDSVESVALPSARQTVYFDWAPTSLGGVPEAGDNLLLDWFNGSVWTNALTLLFNGTPTNTFARAGARIPNTATKIRLRSLGVDGSDNYLIDDVKITRNAGIWHDELAADCVGGNKGSGIDLELAADGSRHMSHYDSTNKVLLYTTDISGVWTTVTVDDGGDGVGGLDAGERHSLVLDSAGKAHIAYNRNNGTFQQLWYATNDSGSWVTTQLTTSSSGKISIALAIDSSGKLHISYRGGGPRYMSNRTGSWVEETPPGGGDAFQVTDLLVDASGVVHMVWENTSAAPDAIHYARRDTAGGWFGEVIDGDSKSRFPEIALGDDGLLRVSYSRNDGLGYAVRDPYGRWHKSTIYPNFFDYGHIAAAPGGKVGLLYPSTWFYVIAGNLDGLLTPSSTRIPPSYE